MAANHKTLAPSNKSKPPAAAKPVLASRRGSGILASRRMSGNSPGSAPDRTGINPHVFYPLPLSLFYLGAGPPGYLRLVHALRDGVRKLGKSSGRTARSGLPKSLMRVAGCRYPPSRQPRRAHQRGA